MHRDKSLWFLCIVILANVVECLDVNLGNELLFVDEEQNTQTWTVKNTRSGLVGDLTFTLKPTTVDTNTEDTDTYRKFNISRFNSTTAVLSMNYTFDFENAKDAETGKAFKIRCVDSNTPAPNVRELEVTVRIKDVNDHTPMFTNLPTTITISEVVGIGSTVFTISGTDEDGGDRENDFSAITFSITNGNFGNAFFLDGASSQVSAELKLNSRLDFDEGTEIYNLTIKATDYRRGVNEATARSNFSYLIINVTDEDDQAAVFTQNLYKVTVPEDLAPGSFVIQVIAEDKDKTVKGEIEYGLVEETNPGGMFSINKTTGNITLVGSLDRKTQSFYALLVSASTTYHDPMHAQVLILIEDANVHSPNFTSDVYTAQVPENAESGTLLLVVAATDSDEGNNSAISYSLEGVDAASFYITTVNSLGYIYVNASLDYDVKKTYNFTVTAKEIYTAEAYNDSATVILEITEILANENNPKFNQSSYSVNVTENTAPGRILQVGATDVDQGRYGSITFSIVDGSYGMFTVDNITGWINTTSELDRESKNSYILIVRASDDDIYARRTDVLVVVNVLDSNDHSPTFLAPSYTGLVVENSNVGDTVLAIEATDLDKDLNALFEYSVQGGDGKFSVVTDGGLGYVKVNGSLDFEMEKNITFLVIAEETSTAERRRNNVSVVITLLDVNDNSPVFSPVSGYMVDISENSKNGTSVLNVSASDADSGTYGQITFSLTTSSVPFRIDPNTGELTVDGNLDRETTDSYDLTIRATDGGQPSLSSYAHVIINVTDKNDHPPVFAQPSYTVNIDENTKIGSNILTVTATDDDQGLNARIGYYIEGGDDLFVVDSTGVISVNGSLDYETQTSYSFTVFAEESSTSGRWNANCTVNVILGDVNEYDPVFTQDSYHAIIEENKASGFEVITVKATDQDGLYNTTSYTVLSGNDEGFFAINSVSGVVTTTGPIDRETTDDNFILKIQASDNGNPNRTTETFLVVEIFDTNDHSPIFTKAWYNTTIPENLPVGTIVLTVKASDLDVNETNSNVRYFVPDSDGKFDVNPTTGELFVNASLDFETKLTYTFMIFAEEAQTASKQQHNASVSVTLTDANEFDPVFTNNSYQANVTETSAVGASVIQISASDQDGYYNQIIYSILPGDDGASFLINATTGLMTTAAQLDREIKDTYVLTVQAEDNGNPGRTSEVTVIIDILDSNDNQPEFLESSYNTSIPENVPVGTTVLTVEAVDEDIHNNAVFTYHILGGDDKFEVSNDGVIVTKDMLDFESKQSYTFLVIANETSSTMASKPNVTVTVVVQDVNEFNPVFNQTHYTANVSESSSVGTSVAEVFATDADGFYKEISYSIVSGDDGKFQINSTTGVIVTSASLDREANSQFILTVRAEDNGNDPARTAEVVVVITVVDVSDHGPKFLQSSYNASIFENVAVGTTILTVSATDDDDTESNAVIAYSLAGGDGTFRVDETGNIILNNSVDYESRTSYEFQVIASESLTTTGFNDTTNITIVIKDVNEFNPNFSEPSYTAVVNESSPVGSQIVMVSATDKDSSDNTITYSIIHGNAGGVFTINSSTGWIESAKILDGNNVDQYVLTVRAKDSGEFPRTAEVLVVISINDTTRNASFLLQDVYNVTLLEDALTDSVAVKLDVRYRNNDIISAFSFAIVGGDGDFDVNQEGEVFVASALNYENKAYYTFTIIVTEITPASGLTANATVNVEVKDVNEFNPIFGQEVYYANVSEGTAVGTFVTQVSAIDTDGDYNIITYAIIHGNQDNNFTINSTTGAIMTATPLDRETQDYFVLKIRASDNGPSSRTAEAVVIVDILDISEHPPVFLMSNYSAEIYENSAIGSIVLVVETSDRDTTSSGVSYSLAGADGKFGITSEGVIYVNGSLDYEKDDKLTFTVVAQEFAPFSHLRHNATVTVILKDVNEFNPEFNQTIYSASVKESEVIGTRVLTVSARDQDKDLNMLSYSIISGNALGNFSISNETGEITLAKQLDRESAHQIILTVRVEDNGEPARTAEVLVVVGIIDSNDHGPRFSMSQYNGSIAEDATIGANVLAVQAVDLDATSDMLDYQIVGENAFRVETYFGLGFIVVNQALDYEQTQKYGFLVYAVEKTSEKRNTSCWVNITVLDANDHRPVFVNSSYNGVVFEGASVGTTVLNVSAVDADSEIFSPIYYDIIDGNPEGHFNIDNSTGRIYTSDVLDRETQAEYSLVVEARDSGSPALTETVTVTIAVLDNNDVNPRFIATPYSASVLESSAVNTTILTVQAVDLDKGQNGEIMYELVGSNGLFTVKQEGDFAHIMVAGNLDYEQNHTITFYIVAKETQTAEQAETNATIVVTVLDVNDNPPVFTQNIYEESVAELANPPVSVGTVSATDKDSGGFAEITYSIIHGDENGNFTIDNKTGEVQTGAILNREVQDRYVLTIQALDGGSPPRKAVATVVVTVTDENEQPPYFLETPYNAEVVENKDYSGSVILKVSAVDPDLMAITYALKGSPEFTIGSTSGLISITGSFDREMQSMYNLTVTVTDQGGLNASEQVIITVEDTNDNSPQFLGTPYQASIPDNTTIGTEILTVQATDMDDNHNAEIIFSLIGAEGKFTINQTTGVVSVSGKLDSQDKSSYTLQVIATDRGIPQAMINSTTVTVNLTDYSNHPPEFTNVAWVGTISEGLGPTFVLNVEANDPDSGILGQIDYSIVDGNTYTAFKINSTGAILTTMKLDFENDTQKTFDLTVEVTDTAGLTDSTQVRITVVDENDNSPEIINLLTSPAAEFNISDNVPAGTLLYVLQGEDLDSGMNGDFEFFGSAVPNNLTIDSTTGLIKSTTKLESTSASSILYTAYVRDKGNPSRSSTNYTIKFNIISNPTSSPFLLPTLIEATVFENASIDDVIVTVNSSEPADNFTILFQLPSGGYFKINSTGSISLDRKLDRESQNGYSLVVLGSKDGKQAIGYVSILVADVNDESPEFQFTVYKGQIEENLPPGSSVLDVKAIDDDEQDMILYEITSGNTGDVFNISKSGEIQIAKLPDYEITPYFNLTVVASDGVNTGTTFVEITIIDVNDNSPEFLNSSFSLNLAEDTPGGASVLQVSAKDGDGDILVYSISGGNGSFAIDSLTGVISTTDKPLDFESTSSYTLNVTATDPGGLKSSVLVMLNITDANDHRPIFSQTSYNVTIEENYYGLLSSLAVIANDQDSGENGKVTYTIVGGSSVFSINPKTGELNVSAPIDRDGSGITKNENCLGVLVLTIEASDNGTAKLTDTATVTVLVTDVNDIVPSFSRSSYEAVISVLHSGDVLRVMANDADCDVNSDILYSFTSVNGSSLFAINATTGNITAVKSLNGSQGVYFLNVTASNEFATPKLQSSVLVTITVIENKNYAPVFDQDQYSFNVSEDAEIGTTVGNVSASDINENKDGVFIYSIENPGYVLPFDIDPTTGVITVVRELDREAESSYTLVVVAEDFGEPALRDATKVLINIDDVNDVIPKFEQDELRFNVSENITVGSLVGTVHAVDEDANIHGDPVYVIHSGNEAGHFLLENSTGMIYLVKSLDREVINIFELTIYAYNHGSIITARKRRAPGDNFDVLKVVIVVTDINDNHPEFEQTNYIAGFKASDEPGTNVTTVHATDKDEGQNSNVIYSIQSGNEVGAFTIDPATGVITTTGNVGQITEGKLTLTVVARDPSVPEAALESLQTSTVTLYKLPETDPLDLQVSSSLDEDTIRELLQNITGPDYDIIIQSITPDGLLSNVKFYVVKNDVFLTQERMTELIRAYCEANEEICKMLGIDLSNVTGNTSMFLGEDDMSILEAMLITLGVIVGIGGLLGILLLCCLRRSKRYMPVYEPSGYIMPNSKAVSFDERPHYYQPGSEANMVSTNLPMEVSSQPTAETQEVELHMDEEGSSIDSAEEVRAGSSSSAENENDIAIAKVQAYMNHALMNDDVSDSDTDSSEDEGREAPGPPRVDGESSTGSTEPLVSNYTITNL